MFTDENKEVPAQRNNQKTSALSASLREKLVLPLPLGIVLAGAEDALGGAETGILGRSRIGNCC